MVFRRMNWLVLCILMSFSLSVNAGLIEGDYVPPTPNFAPFNSTTNYTFYEGWNMFAVPVVASNNTVKSVLYPIEGKYGKVLRYNTITRSYETFNPAYPEWLNDFIEFDQDHAYWVSITENCTLSLSGSIDVEYIWERIGTTIYPVNINDSISTNGTVYTSKIEVVGANSQENMAKIGDGTRYVGMGSWDVGAGYNSTNLVFSNDEGFILVGTENTPTVPTLSVLGSNFFGTSSPEFQLVSWGSGGASAGVEGFFIQSIYNQPTKIVNYKGNGLSYIAGGAGDGKAHNFYGGVDVDTTQWYDNTVNFYAGNNTSTADAVFSINVKKDEGTTFKMKNMTTFNYMDDGSDILSYSWALSMMTNEIHIFNTSEKDKVAMGIINIAEGKNASHTLAVASRGTHNWSENTAIPLIAVRVGSDGDMDNVGTLFAAQMVNDSGGVSTSFVVNTNDVDNTQGIVLVDGRALNNSYGNIVVYNNNNTRAMYVLDSTQVNTNLNADLIDGFHLDQNVSVNSSPHFNNVMAQQITLFGGGKISWMNVTNASTYGYRQTYATTGAFHDFIAEPVMNVAPEPYSSAKLVGLELVPHNGTDFQNGGSFLNVLGSNGSDFYEMWLMTLNDSNHYIWARGGNLTMKTENGDINLEPSTGKTYVRGNLTVNGDTIELFNNRLDIFLSAMDSKGETPFMVSNGTSWGIGGGTGEHNIKGLPTIYNSTWVMVAPIKPSGFVFNSSSGLTVMGLNDSDISSSLTLFADTNGESSIVANNGLVISTINTTFVGGVYGNFFGNFTGNMSVDIGSFNGSFNTSIYATTDNTTSLVLDNGFKQITLTTGEPSGDTAILVTNVTTWGIGAKSGNHTIDPFGNVSDSAWTIFVPVDNMTFMPNSSYGISLFGIGESTLGNAFSILSDKSGHTYFGATKDIIVKADNVSFNSSVYGNFFGNFTGNFTNFNYSFLNSLFVSKFGDVMAGPLSLPELLINTTTSYLKINTMNTSEGWKLATFGSNVSMYNIMGEPYNGSLYYNFQPMQNETTYTLLPSNTTMRIMGSNGTDVYPLTFVSKSDGTHLIEGDGNITIRSMDNNKVRIENLNLLNELSFDTQEGTIRMNNGIGSYTGLTIFGSNPAVASYPEMRIVSWDNNSENLSATVIGSPSEGGPAYFVSYNGSGMIFVGGGKEDEENYGLGHTFAGGMNYSSGGFYDVLLTLLASDGTEENIEEAFIIHSTYQNTTSMFSLNNLTIDAPNVKITTGDLTISGNISAESLSVTGNVSADTYYANGNAGFTGTVTVRDAGGTADCNMVYSGGILISTTCTTS